MGNSTDLKKIVACFHIPLPLEISPLGQGNINRTYQVKTRQEEEEEAYVLQELNLDVCPDPEKIMQNSQKVLKAQEQYLKEHKDISWELVEYIPLKNHRGSLWKSETQVFRMMKYIPHKKVFQHLGELPKTQRLKVAYGLGKSWALFHQMALEIPLDSLAMVAPYFHYTERYYEALQTLLQDEDEKKLKKFRLQEKEVQSCLDFIRERSFLALESKEIRKKLPMRVTHNDTKLNNALWEEKTLEVACLIDLDSIQAGYVYFDVGDGIRSAANLAGEETQNTQQVCWEESIFEEILRAYQENASFLQEEEKKSIKLSPKWIAFELGIRFLWDYLQGDLYFKNTQVQRPRRNLERAKVQLKLVEEFEKQFE